MFAENKPSASLNIPIQIKYKDNYALYLIITLHQQNYPLGTYGQTRSKTGSQKPFSFQKLFWIDNNQGTY